MGLTRLELVTSRLSGVRSNQLSYRPISRVMVLSKPNSTSRFPMSDLHVLKVSLKRVSLERR